MRKTCRYVVLLLVYNLKSKLPSVYKGNAWVQLVQNLKKTCWSHVNDCLLWAQIWLWLAAGAITPPHWHIGGVASVKSWACFSCADQSQSTAAAAVSIRVYLLLQPCLSRQWGQLWPAHCGQVEAGHLLFAEPLKLTDFLPQVEGPGGDSRASKTLKNKVAARSRTGRGRTCSPPARLLRDGRLRIRRDPRSLWAPVVSLVWRDDHTPPTRLRWIGNPSCGPGTMTWNGWYTVSRNPDPPLHTHTLLLSQSLPQIAAVCAAIHVTSPLPSASAAASTVFSR